MDELVIAAFGVIERDRMWPIGYRLVGCMFALGVRL